MVLLPPARDFLAEIDTRRFDMLWFTLTTENAEDVSVFRRKDRRTLALYPSVAKLAARGRFYTDDVLRDYDVVDYNVEAYIDPGGGSAAVVRGCRSACARQRCPTLRLRLSEIVSASAASRASSTAVCSTSGSAARTRSS